jgi:UDPglucose 6-dehydrogenase
MPNVQKQLGNNIQFCENPYQAVENADFLVIATEWPEFRTPDFGKLCDNLREKVVFDGRNLFETETMRKHGFVYYSIGRENVK